MDESTTELMIFIAEQGEEERHEIRKVWHDGRFYFSVVDIITALKVSDHPRTYWPLLKERVKEEGFTQAVARILQFRLPAQDGRLRKTDCADTETMFRLIQSIPSKRVEWIKQWLARVGSQKLDEIAAQRAESQAEAVFYARVQEYIDQGYEPDWAYIRTQGDLIRNELTDEWEGRGAKGPEYGVLTGIMHKDAFGLTTGDHKLYKHIPKGEELRNHMTIAEQGVSIFTETIGISLHRDRDSQGFMQLQRDAHDAGQAGRQAREVAEKTLGKPVVSSENYMHLKKIRGGGKKGQKRLQGSPPSQPASENQTSQQLDLFENDR